MKEKRNKQNKTVRQPSETTTTQQHEKITINTNRSIQKRKKKLEDYSTVSVTKLRLPLPA